MPEKDLMPYLIVCAISVWGGIASYIRKLRSGLFVRFTLAELIGEITISGFVGFVTFFVCRSYGVSVELTAAMCGICAHMGSRSVFTMEMAADSVLKRWVGSGVKEEEIKK
ncbi:MAG: phage holin family protein [Gammaproteobacteria bacterium]